MHVTGGADSYFLMLRNLLSSDNNEVAEFCMKDEKSSKSRYNEFFISGVNHYSWASAPTSESAKAFLNAHYNMEAKEKFESLVTQFKPDIVHIQNMFYQISPSILSVTASRRIPVVETLHDYHPICPNNNLFHHGKICQDCLQHGIISVLKNRCYNDNLKASVLAFSATMFHRVTQLYKARIDRWISPSNFLKEKMVEGGIDPTKIQMIHYPMNVQSEDYSLRNEQKYILFVGRFVAHKGILTLLKAACALPGVKFLFAGDGPLKNEITDRINTSNLSNVEVLGFLPSTEINRLMRNALAVIVPSEWFDNLPIVIFEAFSNGVPVLGSRIGGIPELVQEGTGILFEPKNINQVIEAIIHIANNPSVAKEMGRMGRQLIQEKFSPETHFRDLMNLYERTIETKKTG